MKRLFYFLLAMPVLFACSESMGVDNQAFQATTRAVISGGAYSFDSITDPAVWRTFQSLEEQQAACQIPEEMLKSMTTEDLVTTCMNYPLYGIYAAYNNETTGIKVIMDGFNGFQELKKRTDSAEKLLNHYEEMNVERIAEVSGKLESRKIRSNAPFIGHLGYMELILSSEDFPKLYEQAHRTRLEKLMNDKYEAKLKRSDVYCLPSIRKSFLLGSQIKLKSGASMSDVEKEELKNFVKRGGVAENLGKYTEISRIIFK